MSRRALVYDFSHERGPVTGFDEARDCAACETFNVGIRAPDGTAYCRHCFQEEHPELVDELQEATQ